MREVVKKTRGQGKPEFLPAETGRASSELSDDAVRRRYISKSVSQVEKAGRVHILMVAPRAVSHALFSSERKSRWVFCDSKEEKLRIQALGKLFKRQFLKLGIRDANLHA